jgi:hypothetical protein
MASNGPRDFGTYELGRAPSAGALQRMANRMGEITPMMALNGIGILSLPRAGTAVGKTGDPRKTVQFIHAILTTQTAEKGKYLGKRVKGLPDAEATGDLTSDNLGIEDDDETLLIYNPIEVDGNGPPITLPSTMVHVEIGVRQTGTGYLVCTLVGISTIPLGEYQYQELQMVAQNVVGYDWGRFHPANF